MSLHNLRLAMHYVQEACREDSPVNEVQLEGILDALREMYQDGAAELRQDIQKELEAEVDAEVEARMADEI